MRCQGRTWTAFSVALLCFCASLQIQHSEAKARFLREVSEGSEGHSGGHDDEVSPSPVVTAPPSSGGCTQSTLLKGCMVQAPAGVEVHYELVGTTSVRFALKAQTNGYVAIGFTKPGQFSMSPADAVIGWTGTSGDSVKAYQLVGHETPTEDTTMTAALSDTMVEAAGGYTTVYFTRALAAGRYPIDLSNANFNVAVGSSDALSLHSAQGTFTGNLQSSSNNSTSSNSPSAPPSPSSLTATPSTNTTGGCVASTQLVGGCTLDGGAGVTVHYKLVGNPPDSVTIALQARTSGYVAISFTSGHQSMSPADAVIGWMGTSGPNIQAYQVNGYSVSDITPDSSVPLSALSASEAGGTTTITFTRPLNAGRYPISTSRMTFNVAQGSSDSLQLHTQATSGQIDLAGGTVVLSNSDKDKFWITHGLLMIAAWAFFAPHAIGFARFKGKWGVLLKSDAMWFHLHRILQAVALLAHIVSLIVALTKFGNYQEDAPLEVHAAFAWIITGLLGVQWLVALFLRPDKKAPRRPLWNLAHFSAGRIMLVLALANIGIGIYLYERKTGTLKLSTGAWIGIFVAALATAAVHFIVLALRKSPPEKTDAGIQMPVSSKIDNPEYRSASQPNSNGNNNN